MDAWSRFHDEIFQVGHLGQSWDTQRRSLKSEYWVKLGTNQVQYLAIPSAFANLSWEQWSGFLFSWKFHPPLKPQGSSWTTMPILQWSYHEQRASGTLLRNSSIADQSSARQAFLHQADWAGLG